MDLESKAENVAKSTNEKEDILAGVISDLEAKNRHLHVAMSDMSSEFQVSVKTYLDQCNATGVQGEDAWSTT